jgi:hypothetical protein
VRSVNCKALTPFPGLSNVKGFALQFENFGNFWRYELGSVSLPNQVYSDLELGGLNAAEKGNAVLEEYETAGAVFNAARQTPLFTALKILFTTAPTPAGALVGVAAIQATGPTIQKLNALQR